MSSPYITEASLNSAIGMVIVEAGSRRNATTVTFFSEVAHHPTALWVSLAKASYSHQLIIECGKFSLAVLQERQAQLALECGTSSGRDRDKCARLDLYPSPKGYLFLQNALATTGCDVRETVDVGDYTIFIGDIVEAHIESKQSHRRHLLVSDL